MPVPSSRSGPDGGPSFAFLAGGILIVVTLVFGIIFLAVVADKNKSQSSVGPSGTTQPPASSGPAGTSFDVDLVEFSIKPKSITVPSGKPITLHVSNKGTMQHDLVDDKRKGTKMLDPGDSQTITAGPFNTSTTLFCSVPGHRQAGMSMRVEVVGSSGSASAASETSTPLSGQTRDYMSPETPSTSSLSTSDTSSTMPGH